MPLVNIFEGEGRPSAHAFYAKSLDYFESRRGIQNIEKQQQRSAVLEANPDLRIRIDTQRLREIIPYTFFKCSPFSSIARDQAIQGSDIDGGIILTVGQTNLNQQFAFVSELRNQGFEVCHKEEAEEAQRLSDKEFARYQAVRERSEVFSLTTPPVLRDAMRKAARMSNQYISFITPHEIRGLIREGRLETPLVVCLAGFSIK